MSADRIWIDSLGWVSRREWKDYMDECTHEHWTYPDVKLMDGSLMAICNRCKFIQHAPIAKLIEGENT